MKRGRLDERSDVVRPSTMWAVAERRFGDAMALGATGRNDRANGAVYLAGIVIEILLKAQLVRRYPFAGRRRVAAGDSGKAAGEVWSLVWRSHDLESMLARLPELEMALTKKSEYLNYNLMSDLKKICGVWTIHARYSSQSVDMGQARDVLERVKRLKEYLR